MDALSRFGQPLLLFALALCGAAEVHARVGGGQSYSGPSSSSGGGSSGGGGGGDTLELIFLLLRFAYYYPLPAGVIGTLVVVALVVDANRSREPAVTFSSGHGPRPPARRPDYGKMLRRSDPNFSKPAFLDFVGLLFSRFHRARGTREWEPLRPYVSSEVMARLPASGPKSIKSVENVLIGQLSIENANFGFNTVDLIVDIEANYDELHAPRGEAQQVDRLYSRERWVFRKPSGVLSPAPQKLLALACPNCGAPVELRADGTCTYCGEPVANGQSGWQLVGRQILNREERRALVPGELGGDEAGTDFPTVIDPDLDSEKRALMARDAGFSWAIFNDHARRAFLALQAAWSERRWEEARPLETDCLFQTHRFWIERYLESGLTNRCEQLKIQKIELAKVERDAFYDCVTVRILASMLDFTIDRSGRVVAGSREKLRRFSEYWTFLRRAGVQRPLETSGCPSCGAPLELNQAGVCGHCEAKVVSGEFGWVLTAIEQDEAYGG